MRCEECRSFVTKQPAGEVAPYTDIRVPSGGVYWNCKRCGHQTMFEHPPIQEPDMDALARLYAEQYDDILPF